MTGPGNAGARPEDTKQHAGALRAAAHRAEQERQRMLRKYGRAPRAKKA